MKGNMYRGNPFLKLWLHYKVDLLKAQAEAKAAEIELGNAKLLADKM